MNVKCQPCKGQGSVTVRMRDLGGQSRDGTWLHGIVVCPGCNGKGYVTPEDRKRIQSVQQYEQIVN